MGDSIQNLGSVLLGLLRITRPGAGRLLTCKPIAFVGKLNSLVAGDIQPGSRCIS